MDAIGIIRRHWPAILLALAVGALTALPPLIAQQRMGDAYQGIRPLVIDDQIYYQARAHETQDGHPMLGNPYLREDKNQPAVQFWMPDMVLSYFNPAVLDVVFPFLIIILSYAILFKLTRDKLLSLAGAALLDPGFVYSPFLRTPNPQLFVLLLLALLLLVYALERRSVVLTTFSILLGGALFYIYPFYWTYWVVMVGLAFAYALVNWWSTGERALAARLGIILGGALALGIPYFVQTYEASKLPYYAESLARFGTLHTHFPSGPSLTLLSLAAGAAVAWCWYKNMIPRAPAAVLAAGAALAGAIVVNQQVVTGLNYFFTVHYATFIVFFSVFTLALCVPPLLGRHAPTRYHTAFRWLFAVVVVLVILARAGPQVLHVATPQPGDTAAQRYAPVLQWLDANTHTDDVVYADPTLSTYIPAYTRDNVYFAPYAFLSYMSDREVEARFVGAHYLDPMFTRADIIAVQQDVFGLYYIARYQHAQQVNKIRTLLHLAPETVEQYPDALIAQMLASSTVLRAGTFTNALGGYRVDYVAWDSAAEPQWRVAKLAGFSKVFEANGVVIYKKTS